MEEKKINYGLIIFIAIIIILFIPIISDYVKKQAIEVLSSKEIKEKLELNESFVVYVGDLDKNTQKELKNMRDITKNDYSYEYGVYNVKKSKDINKLFGDNVEAVIIIEGDIQEIYSKYDEEEIFEDVDTYLVANINDENKSYEVADNFKEYKEEIKDNEVIMSVFGRNSCYHCNNFKVVYNAVAEKYDLGDNLYYFDSDSYNSKEYKKIINMNLTIPAKCNSQGTEFKLSDGFGTPLTIFTKKGKVIDCISGYVNRENLIQKLKEVKMISE